MEEIQIIMLGNASVGKTKIILQYTKKEYKDEYIVTLGVDFLVKETQYCETPIQLQIWDTNGNDKFTSILPKHYYRNANGILLVCSFDDKKSYNDLEMWINNLKEGCDNCDNIVIAVNKLDLDEKFHCISKNNLEELRRKYNFPVIEVSAKNNINIDEAFNKLIDIIQGKKTENINKKNTIISDTEKIDKKSKISENSIKLGRSSIRPNGMDPNESNHQCSSSSGCCNN
jgi:small GTP-binding protein